MRHAMRRHSRALPAGAGGLRAAAQAVRARHSGDGAPCRRTRSSWRSRRPPTCRGNGQPRRRRARHRAAILRHRRHRPAGAGADPGERHHEHARRRFGTGIEIQIDWRIDGQAEVAGPGRSARRARNREDYAEASDRLVSRIAQQAAPRIATLIGKPPTFQARSPGQVAAGVSVPDDAARPIAAQRRRRPADRARRQPRRRRDSSAHVKVMVAPVDRRAVRRQPPALLRHAPRPGLEQDRRRSMRPAPTSSPWSAR